MKAQKRIQDIRRHSRIVASDDNLWFYGEDSADNQSITPKIKSVKSDRSSILKDDYNPFSFDDSERDRIKKESPFVVDWQMSNTF
jgi:hypothetical protein